MTQQFDAYDLSYGDVVQSSIDFSGLPHGFFMTAKAAVIGARRAMVTSGRQVPLQVQVTIEQTGRMLHFANAYKNRVMAFKNMLQASEQAQLQSVMGRMWSQMMRDAAAGRQARCECMGIDPPFGW